VSGEILAAALELAELGLAVLPIHGMGEGSRCACGNKKCSSPAKHPRTKHGHKDASTDREQIAMWWKACASADVGVRTGDGYVVLDFDPRNGGSASYRQLIKRHGELPQTWTVRTGGGGLHFYFRADNLPTRSGVFQGLDFKAAGGFVVAPPSIHQSGHAYRWVKGRGPREVSIAVLPDWIRDAVLNPPRSDHPPHAPASHEASVPEGGRNDYLASYAGRLCRKGISGDALPKRCSKKAQSHAHRR
jgi:hypothetical protein